MIQKILIYFLAVAALISGFINSNTAFDVAILICIGLSIYKIFATKNNRYKLAYAGEILLFSLIAADERIHFIGLFVVGIYIAILLIRRQLMLTLNKKITVFGIFYCVYIIFNVIFHQIPLQNLSRALLTLATLFISMIVWRYLVATEQSINYLYTTIKGIVLIEICAILSKGITLLPRKDGLLENLDWVVGTFGQNNFSQLYIVMLFFAFAFYFYYCKNDHKKDLLYSLMAFAIALFSGSVALALISYVFLVLYILFFSRETVSLRFFTLLFIFLIGIVTLNSTTYNWKLGLITRMKDSVYLEEKVQKLAAYQKTFYLTPKEDLSFLLFGDGIGCYSSQAAMESSDEYMTPYMKENIYEPYVNAIENQLGQKGLPFSEYITIFGEQGLLGFLFAIGFIIVLCINVPQGAKFATLFMVAICSYDNYIEYSSIAILFWGVYHILLWSEERERRFVCENEYLQNREEWSDISGKKLMMSSFFSAISMKDVEVKVMEEKRAVRDILTYRPKLLMLTSCKQLTLLIRIAKMIGAKVIFYQDSKDMVINSKHVYPLCDLFLVSTEQEKCHYTDALNIGSIEQDKSRFIYNLQQAVWGVLNHEKIENYLIESDDVIFTNNVLGVNIAITNRTFIEKYFITHIENLRGEYCCISNVHTTVTAHDDAAYCKVQNESLFALPDGKPLSFVCQKNGYVQAKRVAGPDLMEDMLCKTQDGSFKHFFYGSTGEVLEKLKKKLKNKYPDLSIAGMYSPPFRPLSKEEDEEVIRMINQSGADFIWIGLGAPKQEMWMYHHKGLLNGLMFGVGAAFEFHAGTVKRAPQWMQDCYLEWLYRLLQDPRRLFKRYFTTNLRFVYLILKRK